MKTITGPVILTRKCPFCGKDHTMAFDKDEYYNGMKLYERGVLIQNAFPNFTPSQREMIMTGICDKCWDNM